MIFCSENVTLLNVLKEVERLVNSRTCETFEVTVTPLSGAVRVNVYNSPTDRVFLSGEWYADATPEEAIIIAQAVLMVCGICSVKFYTVEDAGNPVRIKWLNPLMEEGDGKEGQI